MVAPKIEPQKVLQPVVTNTGGNAISALSLSGLKVKQEQMVQAKQNAVSTEYLTEEFTETDFRLYWAKYAQKMGDSGQKLFESYMRMCNPTVNGTLITVELPNESSKRDFENQKHDLLGYLRGKLHNHDISIDVLIIETEQKYAFTTLEKYERLKKINPALEELKKIFDLEI